MQREGEDEEATVCGGDDMVASEQRQVSADDTTTDGVHQQARVALENLVDDDPPVRAESELRGIPGVVGGGAPVGADRSEVHVAVEVVGIQEAVGDAAYELRREGGPVRHGQTDGM